MTDKTRDELICQVDGECDSQQELIEKLAQMLLDARDGREAFHTLYLDVQGRWLDASRWATAWKEAAKAQRRVWQKLWQYLIKLGLAMEIE